MEREDPGAEVKPYGRRPPLRDNMHNERCGVCYGDMPKSVVPARERREALAVNRQDHTPVEQDEPGVPRCAHCDGEVCTILGCGRSSFDHCPSTMWRRQLLDGRWTCTQVCFDAVATLDDKATPHPQAGPCVVCSRLTEYNCSICYDMRGGRDSIVHVCPGCSAQHEAECFGWCPTEICCVCGKLVCIEEECEAHPDGAEMRDGRWTCSFSCWDTAAGKP